jgi:hypothetical protein
MGMLKLLYSMPTMRDSLPLVMRRTNADKRRAVLRMLDDAEWAAWSDREIARRCGVNHEMVGKLRPAPLAVSASEPRTYITKHGTVSQMNVTRIGTTPKPAPAWTPDDIPAEPAPPNPRAEQIARDNANGLHLGACGYPTPLGLRLRAPPRKGEPPEQHEYPKRDDGEKAPPGTMTRSPDNLRQGINYYEAKEKNDHPMPNRSPTHRSPPSPRAAVNNRRGKGSTTT